MYKRHLILKRKNNVVLLSLDRSVLVNMDLNNIGVRFCSMINVE